VVNIRDVLTLAAFVYGGSRSGPKTLGCSTAETIERLAFSQVFKGAFLRPFLRGVLLDSGLTSDAGLAQFYLRMFSAGDASLPAEGIQALPELLAEALGRQHIVLNSPVMRMTATEVVLQSGEEFRAKRVICAVDALSAAALGGPEQTVPQTGTVTSYFLADTPPYSEPLILLSGDDSGPINNLSVLTNVQPTYAPEGKALMAACVVGESTRMSENVLVASIRSQLARWFGTQVHSWEYLKSYVIPHALPSRPRLAAGWLEHEGVFYCGDYLSYGSQNGALAAGRAVAQEILGSAAA
jgi:phytoene dehydrogenase-like protein